MQNRIYILLYLSDLDKVFMKVLALHVYLDMVQCTLYSFHLFQILIVYFNLIKYPALRFHRCSLDTF